MKIVVATLSGEPAVGDMIELHYEAPRGGRTAAGFFVVEVEQPVEGGYYRKRPNTLEEIARGIALQATGQYCGGKTGAPCFNIKCTGVMIRVECRDEVEDVRFGWAAVGNGSVRMDLLEL